MFFFQIYYMRKGSEKNNGQILPQWPGKGFRCAISTTGGMRMSKDDGQPLHRYSVHVALTLATHTRHLCHRLPIHLNGLKQQDHFQLNNIRSDRFAVVCVCVCELAGLIYHTFENGAREINGQRKEHITNHLSEVACANVKL